jgi:hypothetical protein
MWWVLQIIACFLIAIANTIFRQYGFALWTVSLAIFLAIPIEICFAKSYSIAPTFFQAWFVGNAALVVAGFLISFLIFDGIVTPIYLIGVILTMIGGYLLII